jgi:uncharacterized protein
MTEIFILSLVLSLSIIQSITGVGVLLIGTPILLLNGFDIITSINSLLPLSILTSLLNLIFFKIQQHKAPITKDTDIIKIFFIYCLAGVFIGTVMILFLSNFINFEIIIFLVILFTVILKNIFKSLLIGINKKMKISLIAIIGIIHGLTNAGGSLLSIFVLSFGNNKDTVSSRYNITYFYFFLALMQYLLFKIVFFNHEIYIFENYVFLFFIIVIGCIIGNLMSLVIKKKLFGFFVDFLAIITATSLLLR